MEATSGRWHLPYCYVKYKRGSFKDRTSLRVHALRRVNSILLWQRASVNSCYYLNEVFLQTPLLFKKQTVHETEVQWPSPHIACILLCSSNFPAAASRTPSTDQCWTSPTPRTRTASSTACEAAPCLLGNWWIEEAAFAPCRVPSGCGTGECRFTRQHTQDLWLKLRSSGTKHL